MKPILEEAKALLEREPRFGEDQWDMLQPLLARAGPEADDVIRWVFIEHVGYSAVRKEAGIEFMRRHPREAWRERTWWLALGRSYQGRSSGTRTSSAP